MQRQKHTKSRNFTMNKQHLILLMQQKIAIHTELYKCQHQQGRRLALEFCILRCHLGLAFRSHRHPMTRHSRPLSSKVSERHHFHRPHRPPSHHEELLPALVLTGRLYQNLHALKRIKINQRFLSIWSMLLDVRDAVDVLLEFIRVVFFDPLLAFVNTSCFWAAFELLLSCFWAAFELLLSCFWAAFELLLSCFWAA